ncbi:uncharacterized protein C8R40DRAFT_1168940 [Lentinula edodes]|uniref:uncharacterized protein n=1 Tax=Lentinula edodes TaxID=5353 RepID=UPI001E8E683B|nr:uncharacterized protein C8R40DRAFT_1168940 [Lentinula edodes]KAH7877017.1 hypothetical protein C8R40DRAFT_1168940 [Lentinula edodes]
MSIPEITFDLFKRAVLPVVEEFSVEEAHQKLRERCILIDEGWKEINFGVGEQEQEQEQEVEELKVKMEIEVEEVEVEKEKKESLFYAPLFEGLNSIMGADSAVKFSDNPGKHLLSEDDHSHYKADVHGLLTKTTAVHPITEGAEYECDVLMTGELNKKSTPDTVDDNNKKVLSNATHIMGADPTRRFMFGLTIDGFNVRLWFFSRSHVFVTEAMNLHIDAKNLIYFALSLSGACREELGYDPTVRRVQGKDGTGPRYIFTIDSKQYITTEAITVRKAKFLLGCATRLFKVQQVLSDKGDLDSEVKVIKDYWLPEDSCTELETRSAIEANIQKVNAVPNLDRSAFNRYFVKIEACEKVPVPSTTEKGQTPDSTSNFLRGQTLPSDVKRFTVSAQSSTYQRVMSVSIPASIMMESGPGRERRQETALREATAVHLARLDRRTYAPKVHCRQLSEFAGEPLDQMTNWDIVLKALESLIIALAYMHSAGFVHRDISAANVLVKDGNAKLNDLEYAKRVQPAIEPRSASSDVKTGTLFFMPVEVIEGEYLFEPTDYVRKSKSAPSFPFRYHYIHDLESALWVFVYLLMTRWPISGPCPSEEQQKARDEGFSKIFIFGRREEILNGKKRLVGLVSESMPEVFDSAWDCALEFAAVVKEKYCALQESLPIDFSDAFHPSMYSDWRRAFVRCATEGWAGVVTPSRVAPNDPTKKLKVT